MRGGERRRVLLDGEKRENLLNRKTLRPKRLWQVPAGLLAPGRETGRKGRGKGGDIFDLTLKPRPQREERGKKKEYMISSHQERGGGEGGYFGLLKGV